MALGMVNMKRTGKSATFSVELADVTNAIATASNKIVELSWTDPADVTVSGGTLAKWAGTLVVRKTGSAPVDHTDGTVVVDSTTKDAYSSASYQDTNLPNGVTYYYRFFPYTTAGVYTDGTTVSARPAGTPVELPSLVADFTYDGTLKTPTLTYNSNYVTVSGDESGTNAGAYSTTFALVNDSYVWTDGSYEPKIISWSIDKAAGSVTVSNATVSLNTTNTSSTVTITQVGDGELSVESGNSSLVTGTISGTTLTVSRVGTGTGTCQVTVNAAASTNYTAAQVILNITVQNYKIMTVTIDESNSNPETCCSYADDATEMTVGSDDWDEFFGYYPVLFKDGAEVVKINPNNYAQDINGNSLDITSGSAGDVMVAFPRRGLKISTSGNIVTISMTDNPNDPNFDYYAHQRGSTDKDVFYLGAYKGYESSSKLRSLSGKTPTVNKTIGAFRTLARANSPASNGSGGSGYDQSGFYQLTFRQAMYVLKYKNLDSQTAVGRGFVDGNSAAKATGGTNTKGLNFGATTGKQQMKLFGLEDFWGNIYEWIDGLYSDSSRNILVGSEGFNDTGANYTNCGQGATSNINNYMSKIQGTSQKGFIAKEVSGSATTYFCDSAYLRASSLPTFGGHWNDASFAGAFRLAVNYSAANATSGIGARLMYL